jgi:hypothetical protein
MTIRWTVALVLMCAALPIAWTGFAKTAAKQDCLISALTTADNDIRFEGDLRGKGSKISVPESVAQKIRSLVAADIASLDPQLRQTHMGKPCSQFGHIYALDVDPQKTLYVAGRNLPFGFQANYLILFDNKSGAITANPPSIQMKWMNGMEPDDFLLNFPLIRFEEFGESRLIIAKEQAHNGSVYNAMIDHYFEIGNDLSLTQIMAVEARAFSPFEGRKIERHAKFLSNTRVELFVFGAAEGEAFRGMGRAILEREGEGKPYRVVKREMESEFEKWEKSLISFCESVSSDDYFQEHGCDFYY